MLLSVFFTIFCCSPYYLLCTWMKKCCSETPHRRLLFTICVAPFLSVISWLVTSEHISEKVSEPFNCSHCDNCFTKSLCNSIIMSKKRNRISLAQKLDIIETSKKSWFSIEDVMKKYVFSLEKTDLVNLCGFFHALSVRFLNQNYCHILNI